MELKKITNKTKQDQWVVYKGRQIVLPANETVSMDAAVAAQFLTQHEGLVEEEIDIGGVYETKADDSVWVANVTGDPDAPATVKAKRSEKGRWFEVDVPNPLKEPRVVTRTMKGGMKEVVGKSGLEGLNLLPKVIKVPPYKRIKLPKYIAKWFMGRISMSGAPDCIKSRPPSDFEPDPTWELDDLRRYLKLIDPSVDGLILGPTEKKIRQKLNGTGEAAKRNVQRDLKEAKERLLKRIHRRVVDTRYRLPTKAEFEATKAADLGLKDPADGSDPEDLKPAESQSSPPA